MIFCLKVFLSLEMKVFVFLILHILFQVSNGQFEFCQVKSEILCQNGSKYRSIDGTCNNLQYPMWGSTNSTYMRLTEAQYTSDAFGLYSPRGGFENQNSDLPLPRELSTKFHTNLDQPHEFLNQMAMSFGQFVSHGIIRTAEFPDKPQCCDPKTADQNPIGTCYTVQVPINDVFFATQNVSCLEMKRSPNYCLVEEQAKPRSQFNTLSAFIDLSTVYGSDLNTSRNLRTLSDGKLKVGPGNLLPKASEIGVATFANLPDDYGAGDLRVNQNPALIALHTIWMREHNRLAGEIKRIGKKLNDEEIYQESRRINIAQFQHIVYEEYLRFLLNEEDYFKLISGDHHNSEYPSFYDSSIQPTIYSEMTTAFRMGHSQIYGRQKLYKNGVEIGEFRLRKVLGIAKAIVKDSKSLEAVIEGVVRMANQKVDRHTTDDVRNFFPGFFDLISRNIQRGRDHGIANYNKIRSLNSQIPLNFKSTQKPYGIVQEAWDLLQKFYKSADDIDLFTGGLSEEPGNVGVLGPTFSHIIGLQFENLKFSDRFFYTHDGVFSKQEMKELRKRRLFDVVCENSNIRALPKNMLLSKNGDIRLCRSRRKLNLKKFLKKNKQ